MSIEDVDYLLENSEPNSLTIFVDSSQRDRTSYPNPSNYVVSFDQPIKNVYGIEILDATVPVTAYTIDTDTNGLAQSWIFNHPSVNIFAPSSSSSSTSSTSFSTSFSTNIAYLANCPAFDVLFSAKENANLFVTTNYTNFTRMSVDATQGSITTNAVFFVKALPVNLQKGTYEIVHVENGNEVTYYFDDPSHSLVDVMELSPTGEWINQKWNSSYYIDTHTMTLMYFEFNYLLEATAFDLINASSPNGSIGNTSYWLFDFLIVNTYFLIPIGSYDSDYLIAQMQSYLALSTFNSFLTDPRITWLMPTVIKTSFSDNPAPGSKTITQTILWTATNTQYPFFFDMKKSSCAFAFGFSEYAATATSAYPNGFRTFTYGTNNSMFASVPSDNLQDQILYTPGIVNLESARFIILRCEEIESHMLGSYANFGLSPGIGLFKLLSSNTLMSLRFDFVNIQKKPFHPIGKLSKLTLTFENKDGSHYNFRGIDHILLLSIKYYAPKNILRVPKSTLNPYYLPNILEYQLKEYDDQSLPKRVSKLTLEDIVEEQKAYL
jgi:hypothetical protein